MEPILREKKFIVDRYRAILSAVGLILIFSGFLIFVPLLIIIAYPEEAGKSWGFVIPASVSLLLGLFLWGSCRSHSKTPVSVQEGGVIILISWVIVIIFSALPFKFLLGLNFPNSIFESVSAWTTTGLSVVDVTLAGPTILFWRSLMQLVGGAGLAIIMISAIIGYTNTGISIAEGRSDQLVPQVRQSARLVLIIYSCYTVYGIIALKLTGMSFFDAVNHSFCAVSTGGFSTYTDSIGHWDDGVIEAVIISLMILGNLSFVTAWNIWRGSYNSWKNNGEIRLIAMLIPISIVLMFFLTSTLLYQHLGKSIRVAIFETCTAITTTGYSTVSYSNWNDQGIIILIILMLIGGGTCSTAGGLKQFRIFLMFKSLFYEIIRALSPRTLVKESAVFEGSQIVYLKDERIRQIAVFIFLYLITYLIGVIILCSCGFGLKESLFEFASAIGTVGLSVGITSAQMPPLALWSMICAMFLGRLEFMVIIVSIIKLIHDMRKLILPKNK